MGYVELITVVPIAPHLKAMLEWRFTMELERLLGGRDGVTRYMHEVCSVEDADEQGHPRPVFPHNPDPAGSLTRAEEQAAVHALEGQAGLHDASFDVDWPPDEGGQQLSDVALPLACNQELF